MEQSKRRIPLDGSGKPKTLEFALSSIVRDKINAPSAIARMTEEGIIVVNSGWVRLSVAEKAKVQNAFDDWFIGCGFKEAYSAVFTSE